MTLEQEPTIDPLSTTVKQCLRGERSAQQQLYESCREDVYRLMIRMVGRQEAGDLTQQVFFKVFQKLDQFQGKSKFKTWLYRLAVNEALQHIRKSRRQHEPLVRDPVDTHALTHRQFEANELLEVALSQLEPLLRSIFLLKETEGLSYRKIAEVIEIPEGTVGSRLNRARRQLRDLLIDLGWEE